MSRRVRLGSKEYRELTEAQQWCARRGFDGFARWYDELLSFHARRKALPPEAYGPLDEEHEDA